MRSQRKSNTPPDRALDLLVMQPTPFCNIACDYCYLAHRADTQRMSFEVVEAAFRNVVESGLLRDELSVIWHAGEPLAAAPSFYVESLQMAREIFPRWVQVRHCIQTNGMLINDRWCELFTQWNVRVGLSIDGPAFIHDRHRRTRDGRPTHARVMQGLECARRHGLPFHVIAVVSRESLPYPDAILQFFIENGIREIGFNIDEAEGSRPHSSMRGLEAEYRNFMQRVFEVAGAAPFPVSVRELEIAECAIRRDMPHYLLDGRHFPRNPQVIPGTIVSVDHAGNFTTWSPELIDMKHEHYGDFVLGNVTKDCIGHMLASDKARRIQRDIVSGIEACERQCGFFSHCGGGAPINKLTENGSFASTETVYCRCMVQAPLRVVLGKIESRLGLGAEEQSGRVYAG